MNRRSFMQAILATGMAPAVVGSGILMPVRTIWRSKWFDLPTGYRGFVGDVEYTKTVDEYLRAWERRKYLLLKAGTKNAY